MSSQGQPVKAEQHKPFTASVAVTGKPQVQVSHKLTGTATGNSVTISGKFDQPGPQEVTITVKQVFKVTVNVTPSERLLDKDPLDLVVKGLTGKWPKK